ncbi:ribonuclease H-like domain-containing protein [Tanacetum coccineum]|uniref:Ribonuclease H-like domain-containing protein n=1 Tax=Tanacetum coccineum TaxID=301880 RepID=A0ABQ5EAR9_9ASTR
MVGKPVWNNASRANHQNSQRLTHLYPKRNFVPRAVLMKFGLKTFNTARQNSSRAPVSINTARPINTAYPRPTVNCAKPASNVFNRAHSHDRRPFKKFIINKSSNFNEKVNTVRGNVTTVGPKAVGNPQQDLKDKGVIDSGCSRHMTGNRSYLTDYEEIDGGFVAFRGSTKGGKITGKGKISTGKLDFEDVYFVKKLKFNLFSFSQMCDKKNSVLFTYTKYVVLYPDFKLLDENQVLLRVPIKNNMYSVNLKDVAPSGGLTCLFAKATLDESNLWHMRLGHINFKLMNNWYKGNIVVVTFKNFLKTDTHELLSNTFVKSIMKKMYCLVVIDDFSRFSWVFFLATKDETSGILKAFITGIENQINHRVKIIRCDNGTEFKNKEMNQFCEMKGIKREFSVARTPQQNRVAERKNRTLIEAARTMLADSKLPTTFWAEAVNTTCYVQNRVLVIKPHNKTPYELFHGRTPSLSFIRPFGCPVTILNTLDHLGKFDGKADEGFFVGYSMNSKAFKEWTNFAFDIDTLTKSMSYKLVYILQPLCTQNPPFSSSSKDSPDAGFKPLGEEENKDAKDQEDEDSEVKNTEEPRVNQEKDENFNSINIINIISSTVNTASIMDNAVDENIVYGCADDPNMPNLEEIVYSKDDEGVGEEADMNNLDTFMPISPIPTTRIHKDHPFEQIIGDLHSAAQTKRMKKSVIEHEPKKVWTLMDLPYGKRAIGTKWVYKNKKDERGIVIKNKARLVAQGYTQEEVVDYDESAFLYGKIEEEVYVCQPPGFEDLEFPDRVYKVEKALYGLHQAPRACLCIEFEKLMHKKFQMSSMGELTFFLGLQVTQKNDGIFINQDKYVDEILKKFGFSTVKTASTPIETSKPLMKDENTKDIDVHLYRFQVTPKVLHLHAVKRIFRYLRGQPNLGLWYHKDSPFNLDRKSTTGGCQFLRSRLISWQCNKQAIVANSTTEAEYVAASNYDDVIIILSDNAEGSRDWNSMEYQDTTISKGKEVINGLSFYRMETDEISERYIAQCFVNGLEAFNGEINLAFEENLISNEFTVTCWTIRVSWKIFDPKRSEKEELAINISQRNALLEEERHVIKTMAYNDKYKMILDGILKDKVELDGKTMKKDEEAVKRIKGEALKEKEDPGAFIFPIRLKGKVNENALADTGLDINTMPYRIFETLGREDMKKVDRGITNDRSYSGGSNGKAI